jgi:glucose/arabinose dehydrogenase
MPGIISRADGEKPGMTSFLRSALALAVLAFLAPSGVRAAAPALGLTVPPGFVIERIATVENARELAVAPNGDLFVATSGNTVSLIADAQGNAAPAKTFVTLTDHPVAGITLDGDRLYLGAQFGVYELPYHEGDRAPSAQPRMIAAVRTSGTARDHVTTSVAVAKGRLYASVGSSCDNCDPDLDATRATIQQMDPDGKGMTAKARHIRNAIALATNPQTGTLWAGVAGQDALAHGHPYEIFDAVTLHAGVADYGWPYCYENHQAVGDHNCFNAVVPRVVMPAYETPIGAAFYPLHPDGAHAFPEPYRGGAFVTLHGSWHTPLVPPRVVFIPMNGDDPRTPVNWNDPTTQWKDFVGGWQLADSRRIARPTGVAVGPDGSLFVSDDLDGGIYRIRPEGH